MKQLVVLALLPGIWANPTFRDLIREPDTFVGQSKTFELGVAVCTRHDPRPGQENNIQVAVASLDKDGNPDTSKLIGMRVRQDVVELAAFRPGAVFNAEGRVQAQKGKFWLDAGSLTVIRRVTLSGIPSDDCDKAMEAAKGTTRNWALYLFGGALGAALAAIGDIASGEVSDPISPS